MNQEERKEWFDELSGWAARSERWGNKEQAQDWRDKRWLAFPSGPQKPIHRGKWSA